MENKQVRPYDLSDFIREMTDIVKVHLSDTKRVVAAESLIGKLVCAKHCLSLEQIRSKDHQYARYSLYHDPQDRFEVIALVWKPGQHTPLHDHDGTWGVEGVLSGRIKVTNYLQMGEEENNIVKLRHSGTLTIGEKSTGQLLPPADCHILEADGDQTAITIHVYGKKLNSFRVFKPIGENNLYSARLQKVGYTAKHSNDL